LTTTLVVAEGHAWFLRRYDRSRALQFLAMIEDMTPLTVIAVGPEEQAAATDLLRRFSDRDLTLDDLDGLQSGRERFLRTSGGPAHQRRRPSLPSDAWFVSPQRRLVLFSRGNIE
jgi:hypothetical protein